jgi:uncharacterized protein (UPF0261 family)
MDNDFVRQREMDKFIEAHDRWQRQQNGSIGRIEAKVDEIHKSQTEFYPNLITLMETEVDRRRHDDEALSVRINELEETCKDTAKRLDTLEIFAKLPSWAWKALFAFTALVVAVLTVLSLTHVI